MTSLSRIGALTTAMVALKQVALAAVLLLLVAGWLHIPDANAFEVLASIVLMLLIVLVAGVGESAIALHLVNRAATRGRLLLGTGLLLAAGLVWYAISVGIDHLAATNGLRAGYINSRFPASLRNVFSFERLVLWFGWMWSAMRWIPAGLLAAAAFACLTCDAPMQGLVGIGRSGRYWLSLLLLSTIGAVFTGMLMAWTPGHGLRIEALSLVLRLLTVAMLNAVAIAFLLQSIARAVLRSQSAGTAEPAISQPRTADIP